MKVSPFVLLLTGFVIWSGAFLLLYGVQATGCHLGWHRLDVGPISALRLLLAVMLAATVGLIGGLHWYATRELTEPETDEARLLRTIAGMLQVAAMVATVITFFGVMWLTLC
ncbi:hypothetical protein H6M51_12350 [Rhizobium sp. AQ_MP]|uniref:hypothetical protein n=1 Tax=Rhizobium sp. AQ_MP TaxID=2761536 RepID=UPI00163988BC|nr:hypothetical protein [Rhizobium sp. AQ_MP]MBC2773657.1 hypothetical protein [Rhizobium sp. AQ_MP]